MHHFPVICTFYVIYLVIFYNYFFYYLISGSFLLCRKAVTVKCDDSPKNLRFVREASLKQTSGLQCHSGGGRGDVASNVLGNDSGRKQSR